MYLRLTNLSSFLTVLCFLCSNGLKVSAQGDTMLAIFEAKTF